MCVLGIKAERHACMHITQQLLASHDSSHEDEGECGGTHLLTTATRRREQLHKKNLFGLKAVGVSVPSIMIQIPLRVPKYTSYHGGTCMNLYFYVICLSHFSTAVTKYHVQGNLLKD